MTQIEELEKNKNIIKAVKKFEKCKDLTNKQKDMLIEFIREKQKEEVIVDVKRIMFGEIDWIKVFKDAYKNRKTSWVEMGHIREWRNATDEVLFAVWKQLEKELKA